MSANYENKEGGICTIGLKPHGRTHIYLFPKALSIKYGDSVLKTLAISGSIIYSSVVDHLFLGGLFNEQMVLAAAVVVIAVLNYNFDATPTSNIGN